MHKILYVRKSNPKICCVWSDIHMIQVLSCNSSFFGGTTVIYHASQTSRYNLGGVEPRGSIAPACPHERAGRCMNQTNKQTKKPHVYQLPPRVYRRAASHRKLFRCISTILSPQSLPAWAGLKAGSTLVYENINQPTKGFHKD